MPKMKTNKGAAKRFKVKKNAIKRGSAFRSHILTKKSAKRKAGLKSPKYVHKTNLNLIKELLA
ncbi:MAG: 50S ribosomal protein L35 [Helicobacter sp.]|nr:50S ribosomal protein L35 [Helicobacter sp.]